MTQCVAVFATEDLSLVIGTNMAEGDNLLQVIHLPLHAYCGMHLLACACVQINKYN